MLTPRYYFAGDFSAFQDFFAAQPHVMRTVQKGELLWKPGQPYEKIHYILSGLEMHYADHERGRRKIISFHGAGTVFPGYHRQDFKIELSLVTVALSPMRVLEFSVAQFREMFQANPALGEQVVDWYASYVNLFLFETIHQEYNPSLVKLSNLLYLLASQQSAAPALKVDMTQDELAEILGISRVQLTRGLSELRRRGIVATSRGRVQVLDPSALEKLCSSETREDRCGCSTR